MKKLLSIIFSILFIILNINIWNANVDETNAFEFSYDLEKCILKTNFNLWGHHWYNREYYIDSPWILSIWDDKHTTLSKNSNISIWICKDAILDPNKCIGNSSPWEKYDEKMINNSEISIKQLWNASILRKDKTIVINNKGEQNIVISTPKWDINTKWKEILIDFSSTDKLSIFSWKSQQEASIAPNLTCPNGYIKSGNQCMKTEKASIKTCVWDYFIDECSEGNCIKETQIHYYSIWKDYYDYYLWNFKVPNDCSGWLSGYNYFWNGSYFNVNVSFSPSCPSGYNPSWNQCIKTEYISPTYSCPTWYSISNSQCIKKNTEWKTDNMDNIYEIKFDFVKEKPTKYFYNISNNNKTIALYENLYKREITWIYMDYTVRTFEAKSWLNTWKNSCSTPNPSRTYWNWYCTWLDVWPSMTRKGAITYTTTKVNVNPVHFSCTKTEYDNGNIEFDYKFDWNLDTGSIERPSFSNSLLKINWNTEDEGMIYTSVDKTLDIEGLHYTTVWKIWNQKLKIWEIQISIKEDDETLWDYIHTLTSSIENPWFIPAIKWVKIIWDDKKEVTLKPWTYQIVFSFFDGEQLIWTLSRPIIFFPKDNFQIGWNIWYSLSKNILYANWDDVVKICQPISDIYWNKITRFEDIELDNSFVDINDDYIISNIVFTKDSTICFEISKLTPWDLLKEFDINIPKHDFAIWLPITWEIQSLKISFLTPISFNDPLWITIQVKWSNWRWDALPRLLQKQEYRITLENKWLDSIKNWKLSIEKNNIQNEIEWHYWKSFTWSNTNFFINKKSLSGTSFKFEWEISTKDKDIILDKPKLSVKDLYVSYTLSSWKWMWKDVEYKLWNTTISWCDISTLWLRVEWTLQWWWKSELTWQEANFSDLSVSDMRLGIRRNAFQLINNLTSGTILNGVRYVEWDVTISWEINWYETLIVKDWNVIIDKNLNPSKKKFWIIVLKDNYDVNTDYNEGWNIYIWKDVEEINAIIYADWTFRSADQNWTKYKDSELQKILVLNWTLFSKNTIGWGTEVEWDYLLPWWARTDSYELASYYDLNYIRKVSFCSSDEQAYSFLIRYNPWAQTNTPIGFTIQ